MESSLLVSPKLFSSTRGGFTRSRIVVASAGSREKHRSWSSNPRAHGGLLAAAAAASMSSALPCGASPPPSSMAMAMVVVGELSPETARVAVGVAGPALSALGFLFIVRIVMSWYPKLPVREFPYVVAYAPTEPLLAATRKLIPPVGGVDVTPVVWFGLVSFLNEILVGPQGLLVLLSQQR